MNKPFRLTDRQVFLFTKDMVTFGYNVTEEKIREIADAVCDGTHRETDVIAMILKKQLEEAGVKLPEKKGKQLAGRKITALERSKGRSEGYHSLSAEDQWAEDKRLGILDWDGK